MKVVLGVGGGIAAYKAAELARALMERGATVEVILTSAAQQFIQPLTFAALTGRKVITGLFSETPSPDETLSSAIEHIRVAQENELLVVAPATADLIAQFARGLAGDFLTTTYLAFTGKVVIAPAMNSNMWNHPATRENVELLRARGHIFVEPESGYLACGMIGPGRLAEPVRIADAVMRAASQNHDLEGETVLITAGPTQEPLDPVRYITNRSSGKMGYALADAASTRGARVILVSGPVSLTPPQGVEDDPGDNRARHAASRDEPPDGIDHHHQSRRCGRLSPGPRPNTKAEKNGGEIFDRSRADAGYPGRMRAEERRPNSDWLRGRNAEPRRRSEA